ncbi:MAG TPA: hypothetical protein VGX69_11850 [Solirubrobacteraceae bacterium]|jgi:hypothetical protein|nr:hypothetical protein [Solirubrobacteraceae bacterium]
MTRDESTQRSIALDGAAVSSVLHSLKEIVSIIMGLALTNCVMVLITGGHYAGVTALSSLRLASVLYSLVLIANIVRFYHGNQRHMDTLYGDAGRKTVSAHGHGPAPLGGLGIDFIVVFLQAIIFAVISFYASPRREFLLLFMVLLAFDLIWNILTQQVVHDARDLAHQQRWVLNNFVCVVGILVLYLKYKQHHTVLYLDIGASVLALNTLVDFVLNWRFYFPWTIGKQRSSPAAAPASRTP